MGNQFVKILFPVTTAAAVCLFGAARADEGMFLLDNPPRGFLKRKYRFDLNAGWLERAQKASTGPAPAASFPRTV
jgi:hypothetical protein